MVNTAKVYAKIAFSSFLKGFVIAASGFVLSVIGIIVAFWLLRNDDLGVRSGGLAAVIVVLFQLFVKEFWTAILLLGSCLYIMLYISLGTKATLQTSLYLIWKNKLADFVTPKLISYFKKLTNQQTSGLTKTTDIALLKVKLLDHMRKDSTLNPVQLKVLNYGFKKLQVDELNLQDSHEDFPVLVANLVREKITNKTKPSTRLFCIAFSIHFIILILALCFDK